MGDQPNHSRCEEQGNIYLCKIIYKVLISVSVTSQIDQQLVHIHFDYLRPSMRPPSPSIPEKKFLYDALKQSLRLDGRDMLDFRTPTFTFGPELGWVECAMGKTR